MRWRHGAGLKRNEDPISREVIEKKIAEGLRERIVDALAPSTNPNTIVEKFVAGTDGGVLKQELIHRVWWNFFQRARLRGLSVGILAPYGTGKSIQFVMGLPLMELGNDPFSRVAIVSTNDKNARKRVTALGTLIDSPDRGAAIREWWPHMRPAGNLPWNATELYTPRIDPISGVEIPGIKDPSIFGGGLTSDPIGARVKCLIFDDPIGAKSISSAAVRAEAAQHMRGTWMSRLDTKVGYAVCIMTPWHRDDLWGTEINGNPLFATIRTAVDENDWTRISVQERFPGEQVVEYHIPLPFGWTVEDIEKKRSELGEAGFIRGILLRPSEDDDVTFPNFENAVEDVDNIAGMSLDGPAHAERMKAIGGGPDEARAAGWRFFSGVDVSAPGRAGTGIITVGVAPGTNGVRIPVDLRVGKWDDDQLAEQVRVVAREWRPEVVFVESNNVQERVVRALKSKGIDVRIDGFYTGERKWDGVNGLPGLDAQYKNRRWVWYLPTQGAANGGHASTCPCVWCRARREHTDHTPTTKNADIVMMTWLADQAIYKYARPQARIAPSYTSDELLDMAERKVVRREVHNDPFADIDTEYLGPAI